MNDLSFSTKLPSVQKLIDTFEWTQTPLGAKHLWPSELQTTLSLLLHTSVPMVIFWGKENIVLYNDAYIPFIEAKHPALLGRPLMDIWPEQNKNFSKIIQIIYQGQSFKYTSHPQPTKSATFSTLQKVELTFSPIFNTEKQVQGILGIITNISEQNPSKDTSVEQLIGGLAHDFNTLLGGVIGNLELMNLRIQQNKIEKLPIYIESAHQAAAQASDITNQLLSFSRRQTLIPHITNPNHTIQILTDVFQQILRQNSEKIILLDLFLDENIWPVFCDPEQFKTALINIFTNACEAIQSISGKINITSKNIVIDPISANQQNIKPDEYVLLSIKDNGSGIKSESIPRITEPFFTTKPLGKRAGLGLSMVYGFARQSKGYLKIDSEYLKGTTVNLYLPRYHRPLVVENFFTESAQKLSYKTLIISKDYHLRMLLSENLEDLGYAATMVKTCPEALTLLNNIANFDFITIDTRVLEQLPNKNSISIVYKNYPELPILFITGYEKNIINLTEFTNEKSFIVRQPLTHALLADQIKMIQKLRENKAFY